MELNDTSSLQPTPSTAPEGRGGLGEGRGGRGRGRGRGRGGRGRSQGRGGGRIGGRGRGGRGRGRGGRTNITSPANTDPSSNQVNNILLQTNTKTEMAICTFYLAGKCNFGAKCRFYHPEIDSELLTDKQRQQLQQLQQNGGNDATSPGSNNNKSKNKASREFDVFKAEAINMAKTAQDLELRKFATLSGPFYAMDLECVACGYGHKDTQRYPCRVSLVKDNVDTYENGGYDADSIEVVLDEIVNLSNVTVVSYMTELTGMSSTQCLDPNTKELDEIRSLVRQHLSSDAILVGHSIQHDIDWLGLEEGTDFKLAVDTSCILRQRVPRNLGSAGNVLRNQVNGIIEVGSNDEESNPSSLQLAGCDSNLSRFEFKKDDNGPDDTHLPFPTKYRLFSLRHCCIHLLGIDIQQKAHNPIMDAKYSLFLFRKYQFGSPELLRAVRDSLHRAPLTPSFATQNPILNGVVLSFAGYRLKWTGRFIWNWWVAVSKVRKHKMEQET